MLWRAPQKAMRFAGSERKLCDGQKFVVEHKALRLTARNILLECDVVGCVVWGVNHAECVYGDYVDPFKWGMFMPRIAVTLPL